jgi:CIC family chloride channel protein
MQHGPRDVEKKAHADLSERVPLVDRWTDIGRKTAIVAVVSFTVWVGCSVMRRLVESGTEWLFHTADEYAARHVLLGAAVILAVLVVGGIVRGLLLLRQAWRDSEGDGIDNALVSFHSTYEAGADDASERYARPTFANAVRKMVMTCLTIGTGGSGGLEAPGVYLGETVAAGWSRVFKRPSADELRLYQLAGIAAAMGTLLVAPFTAALFAAELVYAGRIIYRKLSYCLIAAVFAFELNVHVIGLEVLFISPGHSLVFVWQEYLLVILVAVGFSAPAAIALGPTFKLVQSFFSGLPVVLRAISGALIVGATGVAMGLLFGVHPRHILGVGEHTINEVLTGTGDIVLQTWWILLLAVVAKTLATAATLKSGGSAGMLIPSMYMGGLVGAAGYYLITDLGLYAGPSVAVFVATGMAAALTSVAGVPLAAIAFVIEVYGAEYSPAAALSCAICFTASRRFSLYTRPEANE